MKNFPYDEIVDHCNKEYPNEACGLVILFKGRYKYIPCTNISGDLATDEFCISGLEYADAEDQGEVITIVHSHPQRDSSPGPTDIISQQKHGIGWLIVGLHGKKQQPDFHWIKEAKKELPLYGREYLWHVYDCGSFIRDFYKQEFNIELPDFHRPEKFWDKGLEIYLDCYEKAGFIPVDFIDLKYGDVILFALGTHITTHGAVYVGDNKIAHHYNGRLSCRDVIGNYYLDRATKFLRHKDMK